MTTPAPGAVCEACGLERDKAATGCARGMREFAGLPPAVAHEAACYRRGYERLLSERERMREALTALVHGWRSQGVAMEGDGDDSAAIWFRHSADLDRALDQQPAARCGNIVTTRTMAPVELVCVLPPHATGSHSDGGGSTWTDAEHHDATAFWPENSHQPKGDVHMAKTKAKERAVLVTTEYRGVFFGYATVTEGETISLRRARNCIYWPAAQKGFLGLATVGPVDGSRVGPAADIELRKVTCVAEVSAEAAAKWEAAPWR